MKNFGCIYWPVYFSVVVSKMVKKVTNYERVHIYILHIVTTILYSLFYCLKEKRKKFTTILFLNLGFNEGFFLPFTSNFHSNPQYQVKCIVFFLISLQLTPLKLSSPQIATPKLSLLTRVTFTQTIAYLIHTLTLKSRPDNTHVT